MKFVKSVFFIKILINELIKSIMVIIMVMLSNYVLNWYCLESIEVSFKVLIVMIGNRVLLVLWVNL